MDYIATENERRLIVVALTDMADLAQGEGAADSKIVVEQVNKLLERMEIANLYVPKPKALTAISARLSGKDHAK